MKTDQDYHEWVEGILRSDIYCCQSSLVEELFTKEVLYLDEVENLFIPSEEGEEEEMQEIFEWWSISDWLFRKLLQEGAPVIETEFGNWYGRTETGQSLTYDYYLNKVAQTIYNK